MPGADARQQRREQPAEGQVGVAQVALGEGVGEREQRDGVEAGALRRQHKHHERDIREPGGQLSQERHTGVAQKAPRQQRVGRRARVGRRQLSACARGLPGRQRHGDHRRDHHAEQHAAEMPVEGDKADYQQRLEQRHRRGNDVPGALLEVGGQEGHKYIVDRAEQHQCANGPEK